MPAITTNDLKNGITLELDNGLFQVVEFQHVKPGKGGAFVRTKLRNVKNGNVFDRTKEFAFGDLLGSTGFGLRYRSPIGPIRFDIGFKMDRRELGGTLERRRAFHFAIGQAF